MISKKNKVSNQLTDHLGNVRAVVSKDNNGNAAALVSATDYYPGGMAMPGRQFVNGKPYRYGYQGEFAETDPETGKPAFQLRLYDPRINRWTTTDPMGQYHSPYMAMDNRPNMSIDPTGGCTVGVDCPEEFNWMEQGTFVLDEVVIGGGGGGVNWSTDAISNGGIFDFSMMSQSSWENLYNGNLESIIKVFSPTGMGIRNDAGGLGHYGASRGNRSHKGLDFKTNEGQDIVSLIHGKARNFIGSSTKNPMVQIYPNSNSLGIKEIQILYVNKLHNVKDYQWYEMKGASTVLGTAADLSKLGYSENVTDHVHLQFLNSSGKKVNPQSFFKK